MKKESWQLVEKQKSYSISKKVQKMPQKMPKKLKNFSLKIHKGTGI